MRYTVVVMVMDSLPSSLLPRWLQMVLPLSDESIRFSWNVPVLSSTTGRPRTLFYHLSFKGFHSSLFIYFFWGGAGWNFNPKSSLPRWKNTSPPAVRFLARFGPLDTDSNFIITLKFIECVSTPFFPVKPQVSIFIEKSSYYRNPDPCLGLETIKFRMTDTR